MFHRLAASEEGETESALIVNGDPETNEASCEISLSSAKEVELSKEQVSKYQALWDQINAQDEEK